MCSVHKKNLIIKISKKFGHTVLQIKVQKEFPNKIISVLTNSIQLNSVLFQ